MPLLLAELSNELHATTPPAAAAIHGETRFAQGIPLGDVLDDLSLLRRATVEAVGSNDPDLHAFFDRAMKSAATEMLTQETAFRDRLLGILSHDLRNPLGAVSVGIELVLADSTLKPMARRAAERVASSAARMLRMIRDLLDLTRAHGEKGLPLKCEPAAANDIIADVVEEMRTAHPGRTIVVHPPAEPVVGTWDRDRLAQMVSNLLSNAFDHGQADGSVEVTWRAKDGLELSIVNAGPPIAESSRARIFEAFQHGDPKNHRGLGLGLYIVREIARAHGGDVRLERSDATETRFTVHLPLGNAP